MTDILIQQASRHGVYVQSFAGHLANLFDPYLKRLVSELVIIMNNGPETTQNTRLINRIVNEWRRASLSVYGSYNDDVLFAELEPFSISESEWELKSLKSVVKAPGLSLAAPAAQQVWAGVLSTPLIFPDSKGVKLLEPFIKDWELGQINKVSDIIRTGYITGRTNQQIVKDIVDQNNGILGDKKKGGTRASIKTMVRTATNSVSNVAREQTRKANDDIVIGYEIIATLDSRTTDYCKGVDGTKVFYEGLIIWGSTGRREKTSFRPMPPFHPACRDSTTSILDPIFDVDDTGQTRASKGVSGGKQVDAETTYYGFLKEQGRQGPKGRAYVQDVMGIERGNLLIDGGLSGKEFAKLTLDDVFKPITLKELRKKESLSLAFDKID